MDTIGLLREGQSSVARRFGVFEKAGDTVHAAEAMQNIVGQIRRYL